MNGRWKVADGYVYSSFVDSIHGSCRCSWVAEQICECENVGAVAGEGMAGWSEDRFATSGQRCYHVTVCWGGRSVSDGTRWDFTVDSHRVACAACGSHVVLEDGRAGVGEI